METNAEKKQEIETKDINKNASQSVRTKISTQQYKDFFKSIEFLHRIGIWEYWINEEKIWASEQTYLIFGLDIKTEPISFEEAKELIQLDENEKLESVFDNLIKKFQPVDLDIKFYKRYEGHKETRYANIKASQLKDKDGNPYKIFGTIQDITRQKKGFDEQVRARQRAEESDRLKTIFLANMSHEIRTPMNAIMGFSELLDIGQLPPDKRKEYIEIIKNKSNRLLMLIDDIVEISKFETGDITISKTEFDLNKLLHELLNTFNQKKEAENKSHIDLRLNVPIGKDIEHLYTDPGRLQQLLTHLLKNALKFTNKGYIEIGYELIENHTIKFYIKDTGIGIPKEIQKLIFNRYKQLEDTTLDKNSGPGLGLTLAKNIIDLLGGRIWVDSEIQKGSVFYFTLPVTKSSNIIDHTIKKEEVSLQKSFNWRDKVILVVEDEEVNAKFLEAVLQPTNAKILHASSGPQAIELCTSINKIDLILMDIKMPEMNGYIATKEIKRIKKDIPIIAQTAFAMKNEKQKCINAGCNDYISKPIDIKLLLTKINSLFKI